VHYVWKEMLDTLRDLPIDKHVPVLVVVSRLVLRLLDSLATDPTQSELLARFESLDNMAEAVVSWLLMLAQHGLLEIRPESGTPLDLRLTEIGAAALRRPLPPHTPEEERILIVNPDFEVIVFRHGPEWYATAMLAKFARHQKSDQTHHFRVTARDVQSAVLLGMKADDMLGFLAAHSRTPIPQNVEYSIRDWASKVQVAHAFNGIVMEVRQPHTLDILMEDALTKSYFLRRMSPTLAVMSSRITSKKIIARLRENGIFLRN